MTSVYPHQSDNKNLIYLYDMPKGLVTSVKIHKIIKDLTGYDMQEPVQFRECKPHFLTGMQSPYWNGIIKVDNSEAKRIAD
jgi:hypothetical protein